MKRTTITIASFIVVFVLASNISFADCGISVDFSTLDFGSLTPDGTSSVKSITITKTGTDPITDLTVEGSDWINGLGMPVTQTHWALSDIDYGSMNQLETFSQSIGTDVSQESPAMVHFKLKIPLNQPSGGYTQAITFTSVC